MNMPPKERTIIPPKNGWEEWTYYIVEASFAINNPIFQYIYCSGFLNGHGGTPGGYNEFYGLEDPKSISDAHYMKVLQKFGHRDLYIGAIVTSIEYVAKI